MLQAFHILQERSIIHIDMRTSNFFVTTKLVKILNKIVSIIEAYISLKLILDFSRNLIT